MDPGRFSEVAAEFEKLPTPTGSEAARLYSATEYPGASRFLIAKSAAGLPALLVREPTPQTIQRRKLRHLVVQPSVKCELDIGGDRREETCTIVEAADLLPDMIPLVIRLFVSVVSAAESEPNILVPIMINRLAEILRALSEPSSQSTRGLWGELLLIEAARDPYTMFKSWRRLQGELWDFASGYDRVEVKSCAGSRRVHQVSLNQVCPPIEVNVVIASLVVARSEGGLSLTDLVEAVRGKISQSVEAQMKLDEIVVGTLGNSLVDAGAISYDYQRALESLRFYPAGRVPKPACDQPPEIANVRFEVDLEGLEAMALSDLDKKLGTFGHALPHR